MKMRYSFLAVFLIAAIVASFVVSAAISLNSMGEFCLNPGEPNCNFDYQHLVILWSCWFVVVNIVLLVIVEIFQVILRAVKRDKL